MSNKYKPSNFVQIRKINLITMAKKKEVAGYVEVFPDVQSVFEDVILRTQLDKYGITIKVLALDSQKKIFTIKKSDALLKHETNVDIYIIINQRIFEGLTEPLKILQVEEALAGISWSGSKVDYRKGDVFTYSGLLNQYGYDEAKKGGQTSYQILQESIKSLYDKAKQEDEENGEAAE